MKKKIAIAFAVLVLAIAGGTYYLVYNLDSIIKDAIQKYASQATQSDVRLDSVKLKLTSGDGVLSGLSINNPKGFSSAKAFYLGSINVQLDTNSIRGSGPIIIRKIVIDKPQVTYELLNSGANNLQTILDNTQTYASSFKSKEVQQKNDKPDEVGGQQGRKIVIDDLIIRDVQVAITQELLKGRQLSASLSEIHLSDIGKGNGGATAAQVAKQIIGTISAEASQAAVTELAKEKISGVLKEVPTGAISGAALGTAGSKLKGLFGQ